MTTRSLNRRRTKLTPQLASALRELSVTLPLLNAPDTVRMTARRLGLNPLVLSAAFIDYFGVPPDRYRAKVARGTETLPESIARMSERGTVATPSRPSVTTVTQQG